MNPKRRLFNLSIVTAAALLASSCSTLTMFNNLTPKDKESFCLAKNIFYGANKRQTMDIYGPKKNVAIKGTIIFFYGGGWFTGKKEDYSWAGRSLAALGYIVFVPDYRVYPEVRYPDFIIDSARALEYIVKNGEKYGADINKIALIGHSAGAYNAAMLAVNDNFSKEYFKNIKAFIGIAGPYDFYPFDVAESINAFGNAQDPKATQPVNLIVKSDIKFLMLHSKVDIIVGIYNSRNLEKALKSVGNYAKLIEYDTPTHQEMIGALSIPFRNKADVRQKIDEFLADAL